MPFLTTFLEGFRFAVRALAANKLRSLLTTLGIVIGIVSVTSMFTVINGLERGFDDSMKMLGTNVIYVDKWSWFGDDGPWWERKFRPNIEQNLADVIEERARYVVAAAPTMQTMRGVQYKDRSLNGVMIEASTPDVTRIGDFDLTEGRYYNEMDLRTSSNVAVIGAEVAENLFATERPLGKRIRVGGQRFEVIGVLAKQGKFLGMISFDNQIQMPISTFTKLFGTRRSVSVQVKVQPEYADLAEDELIGVVRAARGLDPMEENDFNLNKQEAFRAQMAGVKGTIYGIGIFLTAMSLLVGGIGVMNIMFVSVRERTKEIGIRKAVGATRQAIMIQFLLEAIMISALGGLIGLGISSLVAVALNNIFTAHLSSGTAVLALVICAAVGIIFGYIPARNAAKANPIEALRYE